MPFREKWSEATWSAIQSTLDPYGVICKRASDLHGQIIIDDIWHEINTAQVIIGDVTSNNANVFYELGIAHALGKDVLLLSQSTKYILFDVNRFRHILYKPTQRGYMKLKVDLLAALREKKVLPVPLPHRLRVEKPNEGINRTVAAFSGIWTGTWRGDKPGALPHIFVVQKIKPPKADVIYAWGGKKRGRECFHKAAAARDRTRTI